MVFWGEAFQRGTVLGSHSIHSYQKYKDRVQCFLCYIAIEVQLQCEDMMVRKADASSGITLLSDQSYKFITFTVLILTNQHIKESQFYHEKT